MRKSQGIVGFFWCRLGLSEIDGEEGVCGAGLDLFKLSFLFCFCSAE